MESINVAELVERLGSDEDAVRKMAAFKLQSAIGDPSFADIFILEGGLIKLRYLTLHASGNTLAYSLTAFANLLEVDKGWEYVNQDLVKRVVELVVTHPLVNILRGAMSILVAIVSHAQTAGPQTGSTQTFGLKGLKPAIAAHPQFLETLVSNVNSPDHALTTNALQLVNSLMRDSISAGSDDEWPKFIKRIQDLGVIRAVYSLMQSQSVQDIAQPLFEFQVLSKVLLRKWRDVPVSTERSEHRRILRGIQVASKKDHADGTPNGEDRNSRRNTREGFERIGFGGEDPVPDFEEVGCLGMMDLADFVRKNEDGFQRLVLEQSSQAAKKRCPIARASIVVTSVLYEHFEIDRADIEDGKSFFTVDSRSGVDRMFKPMLLQWSKLHTAGLQAFLRLWKATGAGADDFDKVAELVRILLEAIVGGASRTKEIGEVVEEISSYEYERLRKLQMELLEFQFEDTWGEHLTKMRDEQRMEALQFVKEQRIRCLLDGAWFPVMSSSKADTRPATAEDSGKHALPVAYRFARLSHNRRWLHHADFPSQLSRMPVLDELAEKIDLSSVSSVVSNIQTSVPSDDDDDETPVSSPKFAPESQNKPLPVAPAAKPPIRIVINSYSPSPATSSKAPGPRGAPGHQHSASQKSSSTNAKRKEAALLTLYPQTHVLASEWLDGLLMLLNQQPITAETNKLIRMAADMGLKVRLLNVRFEDEEGSGVGPRQPPKMPNREGLDEDYYYDLGGM